MSASAQVTPVQVVRDEPEALMAYVAARTAETVGRRVDRADAVVVGAVTAAEVVQVTLDEGAIAQMREQALEVAGPELRVQLGRLAVERRISGSAASDELMLAHPQTATGTGAAVPDRSVSEGDRGLWFLERLPADVPYAAAAPGPAYRLAAGETGPVTGDAAEELAEAVAWTAGLAADGDARREVLAEGLLHANRRIARAAARALADSGDREAAGVLRDALGRAGDEERERVAVALWRLGDKDAALAAMEPLLGGPAKDAWLKRWGLDYTVDAEGRRTAELYGPDAAAAAGD